MLRLTRHAGPLTGRDLGRRGERLASVHLKHAGYRVLARNVRTTLGEIDLIARAPDRVTIVFVEVKTRSACSGTPTPPPEASVTARKRRKLLTLARQYAHRHGLSDRPLRIDVVAIDWPAAGAPAVRHYIDAVRG